MNTMVSAYEGRLREGADRLECLEQSGQLDEHYDRMLRNWLELLAAYEYECEIAQGADLLAVAS